MNKNYGKLADGEVEYAPAKITTEDGSVISNPSAATYLAAGWKRIVDEPPAAEPGHTVQVSGWDETAASIIRIYKQVPDEATPDKARVFSKLKLVAALKEADKWVLVKTWIEERGYWDYYLAAHNFREDNPLFAESNARFRRNGCKVASAAFGWWRPRRYLVMWDAVKFARICQRFGWSAWLAPSEARQKGGEA